MAARSTWFRIPTPFAASSLPLPPLPNFPVSPSKGSSVDFGLVGQVFELQTRLWQMWFDSAQTIALRFWLAPPWLGGSPWVRNEWFRMTAEKMTAAQEAVSTAVTRGMQPGAAAPRTMVRTAAAVLSPYSQRTRSNAARLSSRAARGPIPMLEAATTSLRATSASSKGSASNRGSNKGATATTRRRRTTKAQ